MPKEKGMFNKVINRETILYGIVGIGTSALNIILFHFLQTSGLDYRSANIVTLIIVRLTAYICNKNIVFQSHTNSWKALVKEFGRFVVTRGAATFIDYFGLVLMVEAFGFQTLPSKCIVTAAVIIINYFVGKKHVFKDRASK